MENKFQVMTLNQLIKSFKIKISKNMIQALDNGGFDARITVLGHVQRGGSPSAFDRINVGDKWKQNNINIRV